MSLPFYFNIKRFSKSVYLSIFFPRKINSRLSIRRVIFIVCFVPIYLSMQILNILCFFLDEIIFPNYKHIIIKEPVFVLGVPRSGTTFTHRLLSQDRQFTVAMTWEMMFAPSIMQKILCHCLGYIDRLLGKPLYKFVSFIERKIMSEFNQIHKSGLFEAEEDEMFLMHSFSSAFMYFLFPNPQLLNDFIRFDENIESKEKQKIMRFYKVCIQKHMFVYGVDKIYMTKNPAFSPKIRSIFETFPDARIICLVRTPYEAVPSVMSLFETMYKYANGVIEEGELKALTNNVMIYFYEYPVKALSDFSCGQYQVVMYQNLIQYPVQTVKYIYNKLNIKLSSEYNSVLMYEYEKSKNFISNHKYTFEKYGISKEYIDMHYKHILNHFRFGSYPDDY